MPQNPLKNSLKLNQSVRIVRDIEIKRIITDNLLKITILQTPLAANTYSTTTVFAIRYFVRILNTSRGSLTCDVSRRMLPNFIVSVDLWVAH